MNAADVVINHQQVRYTSLIGKDGQWLQFWYSITPNIPLRIEEQIEQIEIAERELLRNVGIQPRFVAAKHFFVSDLLTQFPAISAYKNRDQTDYFLSVTEQPPAQGVKASLLVMCLANIKEKVRKGKMFYFDTTSHIRHIYAEQIVDDTANAQTDVETQTNKVFANLQNELEALGANVQDNVLRTWIYTPHVDADYPGIVTARKRFFDSIHLTRDTHYIASTGIQGGSNSRFARVSLDAYAAAGSGIGRIRYIQAPEHMSPADLYGVTFERATAVQLGNVDFLFISGTASIDKTGEIVHPGDVVAQAGRTLENISALLQSASFERTDLSSFIVYLRDATDYHLVRPVIESYAKDLTCIYVKAPVCRPGWLIEIEATAARVL